MEHQLEPCSRREAKDCTEVGGIGFLTGKSEVISVKTGDTWQPRKSSLALK